jgi:molybdenum cofactor biosynthesis enzyme MoaA
MYCPRLKHFVRLNSNGTVSRCGHMINAPQYSSLENMEASSWMANIRELFKFGTWPAECVRCQEVEEQGLASVRTHAQALDAQETHADYLQVGGVLDNVCNAACQTCSPDCSTRIGALEKKMFTMVDNSKGYWSLPQDRIRHLDINGGEPSYSKNYKEILTNLPPNLKTLRLNTNGSVVLDSLTQIVQNGIEVTVTVSCDGIGEKHEFMRWPIKWETFYQNLMTYKSMPVKLNLWTTVSVLNVDDLPDIQDFARAHSIDHSYAYLKTPVELSVDNADVVARDAYISKQKQLRGIE